MSTIPLAHAPARDAISVTAAACSMMALPDQTMSTRAGASVIGDARRMASAAYVAQPRVDAVATANTPIVGFVAGVERHHTARQLCDVR